jgi:hypothetical protein
VTGAEAVGGDKSAAAWHPNNGPEVPHADLVEQLQVAADWATKHGWESVSVQASTVADALAALGDTVPRQQYEGSERRGDAALRWVDEARAEVKSLDAAMAHLIEQAPHGNECTLGKNGYDPVWDLRIKKPCNCWKSTSPAVSLALHDAEVKAQALDEQADQFAGWVATNAVASILRERAAAIRAEATS